MAMYKKYIVRLTEQERGVLRDLVRKFKGSSARVRRAQILLQADADGPNWTDQRIADAFGCRTRTVENVRQRLVTQGFDSALNKKQPDSPPRAKLLDGPQEAKIIAVRLGKPPKGFANWSLRLLAEKVVELGIIDKVSHETLRKTLKKTA
jgi:homeodomain-containing protein